MNSIERVVSAVTFQTPDRTPVVAQVFGHSALVSGHTLLEYVTSSEIAAKCQINALQRYGYDAVFALFDTCVEAEAIGCKLLYRKDLYPAVESHVLTPETDVADLKIPDPHTAGRMPELLKTIETLRREVGDETVVVSCVLGPMTLATQLIGIEDALYMAADAPDKFAKVLDYTTEVTISFAKAQLEAGAHLPVMLGMSASPAVIPPSYFRELIVPRYQKIFEAFLAAGSAANWLYIPGPILPILPYYPECGVHVANIDYLVDMAEAQKAAPGICLDGNIKPLTFVHGNPDEIKAEAEKVIALFPSQGGLVLSSGCEIPPESKPENITALVEASLSS